MNQKSIRAFRISTILLILCINLLLPTGNGTPVLANSNNPNSNDQGIVPSCTNLNQTTSITIGPIEPKVVAPGTPSKDADWPIESQVTYKAKDSFGKEVITTLTVRQNPHPTFPKTNTTVSPLSGTCTYNGSKSYTKATQTPDGGVTQTITNYAYRYVFTSGLNSYWAYHTYETDVSFTRINSTYTLGQNTMTWDFMGADCSGVTQHYGPTIGGMVPNTWYGNSTATYIWYFINQWPTMSPGTNMNLITDASTLVYHSGTYMTTVHSQIVYQRTGE